MSRAALYCGDAATVLRTLPGESVRCCVTSPPYWGLRDYGVAAQIGLERTVGDYIDRLVAVLRELRRVLKDDGTLWLNLGDSYCGNPPGNARPDHSGPRLTGSRGEQASTRARAVRCQKDFGGALKLKDLVMAPARVALALQADGWWLREEIIWQKPNPMPESVTDRCTRAHEYVYHLAKSRRYYHDAAAIAEPLSPTSRDRGYKTPDGWDTSVGSGSHGSFHKKGREAGRTGYTRKRSGNLKRDLPTGRDGRGIPNNHLGRGAPWVDTTGTRNARSVWTIPTQSYKGAHFATFPAELARRCIVAGSEPGDVVLDPFGGSGTVAAVATANGRDSIYIDLNPKYLELARSRVGPLLCDKVVA